MLLLSAIFAASASASGESAASTEYSHTHLATRWLSARPREMTLHYLRARGATAGGPPSRLALAAYERHTSQPIAHAIYMIFGLSCLCLALCYEKSIALMRRGRPAAIGRAADDD